MATGWIQSLYFGSETVSVTEVIDSVTWNRSPLKRELSHNLLNAHDGEVWDDHSRWSFSLWWRESDPSAMLSMLYVHVDRLNATRMWSTTQKTAVPLSLDTFTRCRCGWVLYVSSGYWRVTSIVLWYLDWTSCNDRSRCTGRFCCMNSYKSPMITNCV